MSAWLLYWSVFLAQTAISVAMILAARRMIVGPRAQDRVLGLDSLYVCAMIQLLLFGIRTGDNLYFVAALIIAVLGFVSTVALAKFLMRGEVIE